MSYQQALKQAPFTEQTHSTIAALPQPEPQNKELLLLSDWMEIPNFIPPRPPRLFFELFSGPNHPLSSHILKLGTGTLQPFDILLNDYMDILDNDCYLMILRLISSRRIGTILAAPPCTEYSLLKLKSPGPPPCRSPDCMDRPLFDDEACIHRFTSSKEILNRTTNILHVNHIHGGYSAMEQPLSAMSWDEPFVQEARTDFLTESSIISHCRVRDRDSIPLNKHWLFVSNIPGFREAELQCTCAHRHESFAGIRESDGSFRSRTTAEYPELLVQHVSKFLRLEQQGSDISSSFLDWNSIILQLPRRPPAIFEHIPDGGGLASSALWPLPFKMDIFSSLRKRLEKIAIDFGIVKSLPHHISLQKPDSPFSADILEATQQAFSDFFLEYDDTANFDITPGQPFRLGLLFKLASLMKDPDSDLIPMLEKGVDLGIDELIPSSNTWPDKTDSSPDFPGPFAFELFSENWSSADSDQPTLTRLIQQEIDDGFVVKVGTLQEAQEKFGDKLAIGKLGIATQQPNKPRLVLDSTISGLNPLSRQAIQEKCSYPNISNLQRCIPSALTHPCKFLNLDAKSAHKRIKVRPEHQGLLAFRFQDVVYHYQVLHFGGACSAYYWTRLAGIFLRFFHQFLYVYHFGMVFVDDFICGLDPIAAPLQTSSLLLTIAFLNIPLSWHKLELGYNITWIGWSIDSWSDSIMIPQDKLTKLLQNMYLLTTSGKFKRNLIEAVTGHLLWISSIFPFIRWSLGTLYSILSRQGIQLVRLNKDQIQQVTALLDENGQLTQFLQRPYVPQGSIISRMGKIQFTTGGVNKFRQSCFDLNFAWASFWNCRSNRVQIYETEASILRDLYDYIRNSIPRTALSIPRRFTLLAGADAFASQDHFGLGAWLSCPQQEMWVSLLGDKRILPSEFQTDNLQRHIISFETMAQCILLIMFTRSGLRGIDFTIASKVDNQASEAIIAQGFSQLPIPSQLTKAIQSLTYQSNISLQPYRCTSADNLRADNLSRGHIDQELSTERVHLSLPELLSSLFPWIITRWLASSKGIKQDQQWCKLRVDEHHCST